MTKSLADTVLNEISATLLSNPRFRSSLGSSADGEWAWINTQKRLSLLEKLSAGSGLDALRSELLGFPFSNISYGLVTFAENRDDREWVPGKVLPAGAWEDWQLLRNYALRSGSSSKWAKRLGVEIGRSLPTHGPFESNIYPSEEESSMIVLDDIFRHTYFSLRILEKLEASHTPRIVEVGSGYGGLAQQICRLSEDGRKPNHVMVDLPESLLVGYWFLRIQGLDVRVCLTEEELEAEESRKEGMVLVPDYLAASLDWPFDLFFNSRSLSEMNTETSNAYLDLVQNRWCPRSVIIEATRFQLFPNSERHIEIPGSAFVERLNGYHLVEDSWSPWQGGGKRYGEFHLECRT